ncbi:hypothetical protein I547_4398 [Mycobacterium kansasii 824]|nr:hypothetical protein I547_4398 [Mycobacterium kansasii 824]
MGNRSAGIRGAAAFEMCCGGRRGPPSGDGGSAGKTTGHVEVSGKVG